MPSGSALVIGGGIAGMQASLDLADSGFKVYLVERTPSIGGRMAQLDKTFPTNDCAMCTMAPKMVAVSKHPDIELLTYSEVDGVEGKEGDFTVSIKKKARYVDIGKCTGCGACTEACVLKGRIDSEFEMGLSKRGAAYIPFPQAVPLKSTIDVEKCLFLTKGKCAQKCLKSCSADAINFEQKDEIVKVDVGSIIVATGYDLWDPTPMEEFGYGRFDNVMTNLQFERLLSASGPTGGHVVRPSDHEEPKNIAFIQCVGSRDQRHFPYCSQICCMASTKESIVAADHTPGLKSFIFYMDMRAFGKGFQEYADKATNEYGTEYIRARPSMVSEDPETKMLTLHYDDTLTGETKKMEVDMVILATALKPSKGARQLADMLGISTDQFGHYTPKSLDKPFETPKGGIFITGAGVGPRDIPDAVGQASGAASQVQQLLSMNRGTELTVKEKIEEMEVSDQEPRIGVFVCKCGLNIASVVDVPNVAEYAKTLPNVAFATNTTYTCSDDTQVEIIKAIKEHNLNRLIVASCSPRTHEPLFRGTCEDAGLNPYLFEQANIREHCAWVHSKEHEKATEKAKDLVKMAVARTRTLQSLQKKEVEVDKSATVIGGGISGLTAALEIARQDFKVDLIEQSGELGGYLNRAHKVTLNALNPKDILDPLIEKVKSNENITIHLNTNINEVTGFAGNYKILIEKDGQEKEIESGGVVLATGSSELKPEGKFLYGEDENVMTQEELEAKFKENDLDYKSVVMIQCVGARDETNPGCSRTCCMDAVKNASILKKLNPDADIYILFRDIMTFGFYEDFFKKSQDELGVKYIRYSPENPPEVRKGDGDLTVTVKDSVMDYLVDIPADKIILSTPQMPAHGTDDLQKKLKVACSSNGFFMEAHTKLRPLEFTTDGMFLAGNCQAPKELEGAIAQASGTAAKLTSLLAKGIIITDPTTTIVDPELCIGCGRCVKTCLFSALSLVENEKGEMKSVVNEAICKGCGACASVCPNGAISPKHFEKEKYIDMIDDLLEA